MKPLLIMLMMIVLIMQSKSIDSVHEAKRMLKTVQTSASECRTWEEGSSTYWCAESILVSSGFCCTSSDSSDPDCDTNGENICSGSAFASTGIEFGYCPANESNCGTQFKIITNKDYSQTFSTATLSSDDVCFYAIYFDNDEIEEFTIQASNIDNAEMKGLTVNSNESPDPFTLTEQDSLLISLTGKERFVYVIVIPSDDNSNGRFTISVGEGGDNSSDYKEWMVAVIIVVVVVSIIIGLVVVLIIFTIENKRNKAVSEDDEGPTQGAHLANDRRDSNADQNDPNSKGDQV